MTCPDPLRKLWCRKVLCDMENEVIMVEHLGPNGREMIPLEEVSKVGIPEEVVHNVAITEAEAEAPVPKRRRKK